MARAIVRYSVGSSPEDVDARNRMRSVLEEVGLRRIGTGTFEGELGRSELIAALAQTLAEVDGAPTLDHLWIYLDEAEDA